MNAFRLAGDIIRLLAVIALPINLWKSKNCSGISGKTQILYALVCTTRYLDVIFVFISAYNTAMKIIFLLASYLTVYLIYVKFKDTRSANEDSFKAEYLILTAALSSALTYEMSTSYHESNFLDMYWVFSQYLETVAIIPQLLMIYHDKTNETRSFIFYYIFALGIYRALYVMNWVYRYHNSHRIDYVSDMAGGTQVAIYVVFAFFYILRRNPYGELVDTPVVVNI